jgi:hypothetical protein
VGLLTRLVTLPLAPIEGVIWLAEQLEQQTLEQLYGPEAIRREWDELNASYDRGEISKEEFDEAETELLERLEIGWSERESDRNGD